MVDVLESLLFVRGDEGLDVEQIAAVLEINEEQTLVLLKNYENSLISNERGIILKKVGDSYRLVSKPSNSIYLKKMYENPIVQKLSQAALETLAIIAYKQPVTRVEVSEIRGVNCDSMMKNLVSKALIKECGVLDVVGKPLLYETTEEFLDLFNLESIEDLPPMENFKIEEEEYNLFELRYREKEQDD